MITSVCKILTKNDLGITGSHQAGICVPRDLANKGFFPDLDSTKYNPRASVAVQIKGRKYIFNYIYYNNRLFGLGTRNEYRITGITKFLKAEGAQEGNRLQFLRDHEAYSYEIKLHRGTDNNEFLFDADAPLVIHSNWAY